MFAIFMPLLTTHFMSLMCNSSFVGAQRREMLDFVLLILTLWFWLDFGVRCVGISTLQWVRKFKKKCPFCLHSHAYITPCPFCVPQVLETWLTCVCWHMTWNSWIVSIEIESKCLFNTRFSPFYFHLCLLRNSKVLFARAQVLETWLTCVRWHVTWNSWIVSIEIESKCLFNTLFSSFYFHLCLLRNSKVLFARAQNHQILTLFRVVTCEMLVFFSTHGLQPYSNDLLSFH